MDAKSKLSAYLDLVEKMRETQKQFFIASRKKDFEKKNQLIKIAKVLEGRVDDETRQLRELISTGFQSELFR